MRAFGEDQRWASQTFVAVEPTGMDPCELRQAEGERRCAHLVDDAVPMFEFAVRTTISRFDLDTAEGRVQACGRRRRSSPASATAACGPSTPAGGRLARRRGRAGRGRGAPGEARRRRPWRPAAAGPGASGPGSGRRGSATPRSGRHGQGREHEDAPRDVMPRPDLRDPVVFTERQLLQAVLQFPAAVDQAQYDAIEPASFSRPPTGRCIDAIAAAGGLPAAATTAVWADKVSEAAAATVRPLVSELAVAPVPARVDPTTGVPDQRYVNELLVRVREVSLTRRIGDAMSALRRMDSG